MYPSTTTELKPTHPSTQNFPENLCHISHASVPRCSHCYHAHPSHQFIKYISRDIVGNWARVLPAHSFIHSFILPRSYVIKVFSIIQRFTTYLREGPIPVRIQLVYTVYTYILTGGTLHTYLILHSSFFSFSSITNYIFSILMGCSFSFIHKKRHISLN